MMKYIFLFFSLIIYVYASNINNNFKGITVSNATSYLKARDVANNFPYKDIYIYKTVTTKVPYYIIYIVNIPKEQRFKLLKNVHKIFPLAYATSDKRIEKLANNNSSDNIFLLRRLKLVRGNIIKENIRNNKNRKIHIVSDTNIKRRITIKSPDIPIIHKKKVIPFPKKIKSKVNSLLVQKVSILNNLKKKVVPKIILKSKYYENKKLILLGINKEEYIINDIKISDTSLDISLGYEYLKYRNYIKFQISDGLNILADMDYLYRIHKDSFVFVGGVLGYSIYQSYLTQDRFKGVSYGINAGFKYEEYEIGLQMLKYNMTVNQNNQIYTLKSSSMIYIKYRF